MGIAIRHGLIYTNPFAGISAEVRSNPKREAFVSEEHSRQLLAAAPNARWRTIIALARWGVLRIPSELQNMRWGDVDFDKKRITIRSPKTEHHAHAGVRVIPLFPELESVLHETFAEAPEGAEFVVTGIGDSAVNLRRGLLRIITRAGLKPWPKLYQNLRASRATELAERFPVATAAAWLGHSPRVALAHYHQVLDAHFDAAVNPAEKARQKTRHQGAETGHNESQRVKHLADDDSKKITENKARYDGLRLIATVGGSVPESVQCPGQGSNLQGI